MQQLALELSSNIKTEQDLNEFSALLKKLTIEAALNAEMREHLGFDKHQSSPSTNSRNGTSKKTLISPDGSLELRIPRDREGTFSPQLIKKHQTRITSMDEQRLCCINPLS